MLLETRRAMILRKRLLRRLSNNIVLETHPGLGVLTFFTRSHDHQDDRRLELMVRTTLRPVTNSLARSSDVVRVDPQASR